DGKGHERKIVQTVAAQIHDGECSNERNGDSDGGNEGSPTIPQENEDNDDYQHNGNHQGSLDVANRGANRGRPIEDQGGDNSIWNRGLDGRQFRANAIDGLNNIGAGLAKNDEQDRAFAIQIPCGANVLNRVDYLGDILKVNGSAVVVAHDDGFVIHGVRNLVVRDNVSSVVAIRNLALGEIRVLDAQDGLKIHKSEAIAGKLCGINFDADRGQCAAAHVDLADAL